MMCVNGEQSVASALRNVELMCSWTNDAESTLWVLGWEKKTLDRNCLQAISIPTEILSLHKTQWISKTFFPVPEGDNGVVVAEAEGVIGIQDAHQHLVRLYRGSSGLPFRCLYVPSCIGKLLHLSFLRSFTSVTGVVGFFEKGGYVYLLETDTFTQAPSFSWAATDVFYPIIGHVTDPGAGKNANALGDSGVTWSDETVASSERNGVYFFAGSILWQIRFVSAQKAPCILDACEPQLYPLRSCLERHGSKNGLVQNLNTTVLQCFRRLIGTNDDARERWKAYLQVVEDLAVVSGAASDAAASRQENQSSIKPLKMLVKSISLTNVVEERTANVDLIWIVYASKVSGLCVAVCRVFLSYTGRVTEPLIVYPLFGKTLLWPSVNFSVVGATLTAEDGLLLFWTQHERSIDPDAPRKTQKGKDETLFFVVTVPCPITLRSPMWIKCSPAQRVQTVTTCLPRILNVGEAFTTAWTPERIAGLNPKLHYYSNPNSLESPRTPTSKGINKTVYDLTVQSSSHSDGSEETRRGRYVEKEITGKTRKLCNQSAQHMMPNYSCFNTEDFDRKTKARNEQRLDQIKKCVSEKVTVPFLKIHVISNSLMYHKNVPQRRVPCAAEDEKLVPGWEETHSFDFLCIMETQEKHYNATRRLVRRFQFLSSYLIIHEIFRSLPLHFVKTHNLNQILKNFSVAVVVKTTLRPADCWEYRYGCRLSVPSKKLTSRNVESLHHFVLGSGLLCGRFRQPYCIIRALDSSDSWTASFKTLCSWGTHIVYQLLGCEKLRSEETVVLDIDRLNVVVRRTPECVNVAARFRFELQQLRLFLLVALNSKTQTYNAGLEGENCNKSAESKTERADLPCVFHESVVAFKLVNGLLDVVRLSEEWNAKWRVLKTHWADIPAGAVKWVNQRFDTKIEDVSNSKEKLSEYQHTIATQLPLPAEEAFRCEKPANETWRQNNKDVLKSSKKIDEKTGSANDSSNLNFNKAQQNEKERFQTVASNLFRRPLLLTLFHALCKTFDTHRRSKLLEKRNVLGLLELLNHWDATLVSLLGECSGRSLLQHVDGSSENTGTLARALIYRWMLCAALLVPVKLFFDEEFDPLRDMTTHGTTVLDNLEVEALKALLVWDMLREKELKIHWISAYSESPRFVSRATAILKNLITMEVGLAAVDLLLVYDAERLRDSFEMQCKSGQASFKLKVFSVLKKVVESYIKVSMVANTKLPADLSKSVQRAYLGVDFEKVVGQDVLP